MALKLKNYKVMLITCLLFISLASTLIIDYATSMANFTLLKLNLFFLPLLIYCIIFFHSKDKFIFLFSSMLLLFPILGLGLPPKRLGLSIFDVMALMLFTTLLYRKEHIDFFPSRFLLIPLILMLPSLLSSSYFLVSLNSFTHFIIYYLFFVSAFHFFLTPGMFERFNRLLAISVITLCILIFYQYFSGTIFSFFGRNPNMVSKLHNITIFRPSGTFQDPQKTSLFLAISFTYLLILLYRNFFKNISSKLTVILSIVFSFLSLLMIASRAPLIACLIVSLTTIFFFSELNLSQLTRVFLLAILLVSSAVIINYQYNGSIIRNLLLRFYVLDDGAQWRLNIWKESWPIFHVNPFFGIGPGNYANRIIALYPTIGTLMSDFYYIPTQPESGYLKILYEVGLIGMIGFLTGIIGTFIYIAKGIFKINLESVKSSLIASAAGLTVFLLSFATLYSLDDSRIGMIVVLMLAIVYSSLRKHETTGIKL